MLHCCRAIRLIIPDLIEIGIDVLTPIQVRAKGMNPVELGRDFGDVSMALWTFKKTLPLGTVEDVRAEVRDRVQTLGKRGGFALGSTHNIQTDTPLVNILAVYDEARKSKP
ncbi:MAG: uroporphyrinogen decarboxylase family protein [Thermoproteota archaeon]